MTTENCKTILQAILMHLADKEVNSIWVLLLAPTGEKMGYKLSSLFN